MISACDADETHNYISKYTEEVMLNRAVVVASENDDANQYEEDNLDDKPYESGAILEQPKEVVIDKTSANYYKHNGVIDCHTIDECIDLSYTIKQQFKDIIKNAFYLDVLDVDGNNLGYFIDYTFNDYQFQDSGICKGMLLSLQEAIKDHNIDFICTDNGLFRAMMAK